MTATDQKIFLFKFLAFYFGCLACCLLQRNFGFPPVLASVSVGFIGTFYHFSRVIEKSGIHAVIYAGSFAGMCSYENLPSHEHILAISLLGTLTYLLLKPHFNGFGGKLGTVAFISTIVIIFTKNLT